MQDGNLLEVLPWLFYIEYILQLILLFSGNQLFENLSFFILSRTFSACFGLLESARILALSDK